MEKEMGIKSKSYRESNIELLRIIAMIMIVAHHIAVHSGFGFATDSISVNKLWIQFIQMGGKIGVNIFVLISGYFSITANSVKIKKLIMLWLQIFTYSAGIFLIIVTLSPQAFGIKAFVENVLPITSARWWFASTYFVLYLLSPYINKLLHALAKKEYQRLLVLLFLCWCIVPTVLNADLQSNALLWFVFLYALAGYLRLHFDMNTIKSGKCILIALAVILITFSSVIVFDILGIKIAFFAAYATFFYDMQKLPILIISLMLFMGFANAKIGYVPFINVISSTCFGVYLIHDNDYIRNLLWHRIFQNAAYQNSPFLILYTLMEIVIVFAVCAMLEWLRIHLLEKVYVKPVDNFSSWVSKRLENFFSADIFEKI